MFFKANSLLFTLDNYSRMFRGLFELASLADPTERGINDGGPRKCSALLLALELRLT